MRFARDYAEIIKDITYKLKKYREVKWAPETREYFSRIKKDFGESLILVSPNYEKTFSIFSFASTTIVAVRLLQKKQRREREACKFFQPSDKGC